MIRTPSLVASILLACLSLTGYADTIHLKNGSVIKGKVSSFTDDQFIVLLETGSGRYMSRATIYVGDVAKIEFDSAGTGQLDSSTLRTDEPGPTIPEPTAPGREESVTREPSPEPRSEPAETRPPPEPVRDPEPTVIEPEPPARRPTGQVRTATVDVLGRRDWTSTGLIVKRGERIFITATGTVALDPGSGRMSGPEGVDDPDPKKLMLTRPSGALIAVIGADNDDFIFVGRQADFVAARDGLLFLSVNEGVLSDNTGSYKAVVEIESQRSEGR